MVGKMSYNPDYTSEDLPPILIDGIASTGNTFVDWIVFIVLIIIGTILGCGFAKVIKAAKGGN